jgi:hypothetical protein
MKTVKIVPDGWECTVEECSPGFFWYDHQLCFKSEYAAEMQYYCSSGESFMPRKIMVQPVLCEELDEEK